MFKYMENGLVGLVGGKKVIVVLICGGMYFVGLVVVMDF